MSLIIEKSTVYGAQCVLEKTKEILTAWKEAGKSVDLDYKLPKEFSIDSLVVDNDVVHVITTGRF